MKIPLFLYVLFSAFGFACGGVMYSYLIPLHAKGIDVVAASPDHNAGVYNATMYAGVGCGLACAICDLAKGFIPVFIAWHILDRASPLFALAVASPVLGHIVAPFSRALSGKGICTAFGAMLGLMPLTPAVFLFAFFYVFFLVVIAIKPHELTSVFACVCFSLVLVMRIRYGLEPMLAWSCIGVAACVAVRAIQTMPHEERVISIFGKKPLWKHAA